MASGSQKSVQKGARPNAGDDSPRLLPVKKVRREYNIFDAVAGRVGGVNGYLAPTELLSTNIKPLTPEEVLFRRVNAPADIPIDLYSAEQRLRPDQSLPDSDLLKAIHSYASDFYSAVTKDKGKHDFRTLNDTALLAMGVLLEEAATAILGDTGDMVLVEPEGLENGLPESKMVRYQVKGRVRPPPTPQYLSEESEDEELEVRPTKRRRANYRIGMTFDDAT